MNKVGLIGWPVEHSLSPVMHNAAFAALNLDWRYDLLPVKKENLRDAITSWLENGYRGFNVTVPYKVAVLEHPAIAQVEPAVAALGAANTLIRLEDGTLRVANTDWMGFADDLDAHGIVVKDMTALILGTGGAARAVVYALRQRGVKKTICVSRTSNSHHNAITYRDLTTFTGRGEGLLIVNCTPVGMQPDVRTMPWPLDIPLPAGAVLYDLIYNPAETMLMQRARMDGLKVIGGLGMLIRQGAAALQHWTGSDPPYAVMERAAVELLQV